MAILSSRTVRPSLFLFLAASLLGSDSAWAQSTTSQDGIRRSVIPVNSTWPGARPGQIAISEDGRRVVYQAEIGDGWQLFVHELGKPAGKVVTAPRDLAYFGEISPNGEWLMFGHKRWVWKTPLSGGEVMNVWRSNHYITWETDDAFLISRNAGGLARVPADGTLQREDIVAVDSTTGATNYGSPSMLPDGQGALVSVGFGTGYSNRQIGVVSLPGGNLTLIPELGAINPRYSDSGHILFTVENVLKAIPFDLDRLEATGEAATIVEGVHVYSNQMSQFDISKNGVLVYIPGPYEVGRSWPRRLMWVDRTGREELFHTAEHNFQRIAISPNRRYIAAEGSGGATLYLYDNRTGAWTRLAAAVGTAAPVWGAESLWLYYSQNNAFGRQAVDGTGEWEELLPGDRDHGFWGFSMSGDGTQVLGTSFLRESPEVWQLGTVSTEGANVAQPLFGASPTTRRNPALSQDGNWLAYVEKDAEGLDHVYVEPYPSGGDRLLVSEGDASEPVWGRGLELFYRDAANLVSARLAADPALRVVDTKPLFSITRYSRYLNRFAATYDYDPATDRFLLPKHSIPNLPGTDIQVIENGFELLNRLAPSGGGR